MFRSNPSASMSRRATSRVPHPLLSKGAGFDFPFFGGLKLPIIVRVEYVVAGNGDADGHKPAQDPCALALQQLLRSRGTLAWAGWTFTGDCVCSESQDADYCDLLFS